MTSASARVQFIEVKPSDAARMSSWAHHISRLTGSPLAVAPDRPVTLWQLTAANHRVLARCAVAFESVAAAQADVASVIDGRDALSTRMVRLESNRAYGWALFDRGIAVLTCARWYSMERDRRESLRMARLGLDLLAASLHAGDRPVAMAEGAS